MLSAVNDIVDNDLTFKFAVAATCFLVYDTLIHIDVEVKYIWSGPSTWTQYVYVFIRHFPYIAQGTFCILIAKPVWSATQCSDWVIYQLTVNEALTVAVEAVLMVRIYAMFNRNILIVTIVLLLFTAEVIIMITVLALSIPKMTFTAQCTITHTPVIFTCYWIIPLAFETILFGLTLVRFITSLSMSRPFGSRSIMYILMRDGTWAYGVIFMIMLINTLFYHLFDNPLAGLCFFWELSALSFAGSHVLLNLRRLATRNTQLDPSFLASDELDTIHFASLVTQTTEAHLESAQDDMELREMRIVGSGTDLDPSSDDTNS